jgi:hypothetical protein
VTRWSSLLLLAAACSPHGADPNGEAADTSATNLDGWEDVSFGIARNASAGTGTTALVVYGGFGAQPAHTQSWAAALAAARGTDLELGTLYAVRGPHDALYTGHEIGNRTLAAELTRTAPERIVVVAHSSGAFVAHELLGALDTDTRGRTSYFNLDGGTNGLTQPIVNSLQAMSFVFASDPAVGLSRNGAFMKASAKTFAGSHAVEVVATGSGCMTSNCLHDALITSRPHDPQTFNVALGYTDFDGREVRVSYFDP